MQPFKQGFIGSRVKKQIRKKKIREGLEIQFQCFNVFKNHGKSVCVSVGVWACVCMCLYACASQGHNDLTFRCL